MNRQFNGAKTSWSLGIFPMNVGSLPIKSSLEKMCKVPGIKSDSAFFNIVPVVYVAHLSLKYPHLKKIINKQIRKKQN